MLIPRVGAQLSADSLLGGFFLIGGVIMFFDRAMYASLSISSILPFSNLSSQADCSQARNGQCSSSSGLLLPPKLIPTPLLDPVPHRPHRDNRAHKDSPLLRPPPESKGYDSLLHGPVPDIHEVVVCGVHSGIVWDIHPIW